MKKQQGFTLIELLVVVAIIGILAAIAIPNLLLAVQRSKQKRTMVDMRNMATAWESRNVESGRYNAAGAGTLAVVDKPVLLTDLEAALSPTYIRTMPRFDGWGFPLSCYTSEDWGSSTNSQMYAIISPGKDGSVAATIVLGATTSFDCDLVYSNGSFLAYPDGASTK
jgi:type II secretion system protein G